MNGIFNDPLKKTFSDFTQKLHKILSLSLYHHLYTLCV